MANYETWAVALWIDNEESSYRYWRDYGVVESNKQAADELRGESIKSVKEAKRRLGEVAKGILAARLKDELTEAASDLGATMWADLLSAALSEVDWHEVVEHLLAE